MTHLLADDNLSSLELHMMALGHNAHDSQHAIGKGGCHEIRWRKALPFAMIINGRIGNKHLPRGAVCGGTAETAIIGRSNRDHENFLTVPPERQQSDTIFYHQLDSLAGSFDARQCPHPSGYLKVAIGLPPCPSPKSLRHKIHLSLKDGMRDYSLRPSVNRFNLLGMKLLDQENLTQLTMEELLLRFPGARRTLFQLHHIGGCSSCGFALSETLAEICLRNGGLDPEVVLKEIETGHEEDEKLLISPSDLLALLKNPAIKLLDIRTREEFEAVSIPGSEFMTQEIMQTSMNWPKETEIILIDHTGSRVLDAAAYFAGHGFTQVKGLKGGIDAYAATADTTLPRYTVEAA